MTQRFIVRVRNNSPQFGVVYHLWLDGKRMECMCVQDNEPHDMPTELVLKNDQAAIDGIRASGARQLILAPGNGFTGGHSWTQVSTALYSIQCSTFRTWRLQVTGSGDQPSSDFINMIRDPLHNTAIEVHEVKLFFVTKSSANFFQS